MEAMQTDWCRLEGDVAEGSPCFIKPAEAESLEEEIVEMAVPPEG